MFSFADLMNLYAIYTNTNPENIPNVTFILTLPNSSTFAIKIDNLNAFKSFLSSILTNPDAIQTSSQVQTEINRNNIFNKMCCSSCNPSNFSNGVNIYDKFISGFLNTLKNNGISLYRATDNVNGWEKLNPPLNSNSTVYTSSPCNN
ncbi:hypothetical protein OX283_009785 [Flavobacterium sp. SUN052]|uniref:hypothetical protein n=1 Tax=Flavobacterium sp. SUN052 TaxID=3002441 RepID=UPI00237E6F3C|nr:hypothetical protein [Flavobacterium sp. SUN052]MEC4004946.1 hypothetical protein [Flavobacterium sp. SUN052]